MGLQVHSTWNSVKRLHQSTLKGTALALLGASAAMAQADNPNGPYLGAGWGRFKLNVQNLDDAGTAASDIVHSKNNAQKYFLGYRMNPYWALEAAYIDLRRCGDRFTATGSNGNYRVDISGFSPALVGSVPIGPFEVFAKVGQYYYESKLRAEYETIEIKNAKHSDALWLSASWRF